MPNIVYILTNPSMPGLVKIGKATDLNERLRALYVTGVPTPFHVYYACEVDDNTFVESQAHIAFGEHRVNPRREFFKVDPERVLAMLKLAEKKDITPVRDLVEFKELPSIVSEKREKFRFSQIGILPDMELSFVRDSTIIATVVNDTQILFENELTSLSKAAKKVLQVRYGSKAEEFCGPQYWCYNGKTLTELRNEIEE